MKTNFSIYDNKVYVTVLKDNNVVYVYESPHLKKVVEYNSDFGMQFTSAEFCGNNKILFTTKGDYGKVFIRGLATKVIDLSDDYCSVIIKKHLTGGSGQEYLLQGKSRKDGEIDFFVYDVDSEKIVTFIPLSRGCSDVEYIEDEKILALTKHIRYMDDDDEMQYRIVSFDIKNYRSRNMTIEDQISKLDKYSGIYSMEDFMSCQYVSQEIRNGFRSILFDNFLYDWSENCSISSLGRYYLQKNKDIKGILVGDVDTGDVVFFFELPSIIEKAEKFYFDDLENELYAVTSDKVYCYSVSQNSKLIQQVNQLYNQSFMSLQQNAEFKKIFYKCLLSAELNEVNCLAM